jgi:hypothetical protein
MTLVKTDIGGNITVWIFFCKIAVINSISIQSFSFPICYIGKQLGLMLSIQFSEL